MRRTPMTIGTIGTKERRDIHLVNGRKDEPRKVIFRQPLPQVRRQQQLLIPITSNEVLGHADILLNPPDNPLFATATTKSRSGLRGLPGRLQRGPISAQ